MSKARGSCTETSVPLCELYEQLRERVLASSRSFGQTYGLGVIIVRGMAVWIETVLAAGMPEVGDELAVIGDGCVGQSNDCQRLGAVLAEVIIVQCQQEA